MFSSRPAWPPAAPRRLGQWHRRRAPGRRPTSARRPAPRSSSTRGARPPSREISRALGTTSPGRLDAVRPAGGPVSSEPLRSFSYELYDSIQRYEALAGATEEAGTSHGEVDARARRRHRGAAREPRGDRDGAPGGRIRPPRVASPDVPIVVNDAGAARDRRLPERRASRTRSPPGSSRSGRYVPMIHQMFAEEGLPQDLAMIAFIESSFLPHALSNQVGARRSGSSCRAPDASTA